MDILEMLLKALQGAIQQRNDDAMLRDIVTDLRKPPTLPASPTVGVVGAGRVVTGNDGAKHGGWANTPSIDNWRPPDQRIFDQLMDQRDALDRAERREELERLKRGGERR
jgi:hypothetical protein